MTAVLTHRLIQLETVHNMRHLGGYRTRDGRETRDSIIRAASLHALSGDGVIRLREMRVSAIVDLRSAAERERMPTPGLDGTGISHIFAPVFEQDASPASFAEDFPGYAAVYPRFLESGRNAYRALFGAIAESEGGVVFHCAAGKDRTGVAAALLLDLADVVDEDIIEDYSHSAELIKDAFKDWKPAPGAETRPPISAALREKLLGSNPADMASTLVHLRERYGSARGYIKDLGFSSAEVSALRSRLVR